MGQTGFLVVDDNRLDLDYLTSILQYIRPEVRVFSIPEVEDVLEMSSLRFDAAFIEPEREAEDKMSGIELAARLRHIHKDTHIIFVTKSRKYWREAFRVHADAYLLKKVTVEDVLREINYISFFYPAPLRITGKVFIQTFGGFSVFIDGKSIDFERKKAKELLAVLVHKRGVEVTAREACAYLFGGKRYSEAQNRYYHVLVHSLVKTLEHFGIERILIRTKNYLAVNINNFECDSYLYLKGDPQAIQQYHGDYLICYDWTDVYETFGAEEKSRKD